MQETGVRGKAPDDADADPGMGAVALTVTFTDGHCRAYRVTACDIYAKKQPLTTTACLAQLCILAIQTSQTLKISKYF